MEKGQIDKLSFKPDQAIYIGPRDPEKAMLVYRGKHKAYLRLWEKRACGDLEAWLDEITASRH